jgi:hypothetical protein
MSALSLSEAKTHLNIEGTTDDGELQTIIDAAEGAIAGRCGPLASTAVTARVPGGTRSLVLPMAPVISLTSVTPVGSTALDVSTLYLNQAAGVVEFADGFLWFIARRYDVVFEAGRSAVPADLLLAVKEMVRHLWLTQRGSAPGSPGALPNTSEFEVVAPETGRSYSFPWRVEQLLTPYLQVDL